MLDEADRMLDMGFIHDIRRIVAKLPAKRQTLFFSATMPREIAELANHMLRDPVRVAVTPAATTVERIEQRLIHVDRAGKPALLAESCGRNRSSACWSSPAPSAAPTRSSAALAKAGLAAEAIHGNKSQNQRERVLAAFRAGRIRTLVATDIAARGIDVEGISHVVNYDLPNIPESYVHRIGRTARAGADGDRDLVLRCGGAGLPARHREADPHVHSGDRPPQRQARRTGARRQRRREGAAEAAAPAAERPPGPRPAGIPTPAATTGRRREPNHRSNHQQSPSRAEAARATRTSSIARRAARSGTTSARSPSCSNRGGSSTVRPALAALAARAALTLHRDRRKIMAKEELLEFDGTVTEVLPDGNFRVKLDNEHQMLAYMSGKMRKFRIRTGVGDRVVSRSRPTISTAAASISATRATDRPPARRDPHAGPISGATERVL